MGKSFLARCGDDWVYLVKPLRLKILVLSSALIRVEVGASTWRSRVNGVRLVGAESWHLFCGAAIIQHLERSSFVQNSTFGCDWTLLERSVYDEPDTGVLASAPETINFEMACTHSGRRPFCAGLGLRRRTLLSLLLSSAHIVRSKKVATRRKFTRMSYGFLTDGQ